MSDEPAVPVTPSPLDMTGAGWTFYGPEGSVDVDDWDGLTDVLYETAPNNDLVEHTLDGDCICDPALIMIGTSNAGKALWLSMHSSIDGRELVEVAESVELINVTVSLPLPVPPSRPYGDWFKETYRLIWESKHATLRSKLNDSVSLCKHYALRRPQEDF